MATIIHVTKSGRKTPIFTLAKGDARTKRVQFVIPRDDAEVPLDELTWRIVIKNAVGEQDGTALPKEVHGDHIDLWWTCGYIAANAVGLTTIYLNAFNVDGKMQWSSGEYCIHVIPAKEDEQEEGNGLSELQELIESARQAMENATQETIAATQSAIAAAGSANEAANTAEKAAENAEDAAGGANNSAIRADEAAESADNAKEDANTAAENAQQAANTANTAANNANQATNTANTAAEAADEARLAIAEELNKKAPAIPVDASGDIVTITDGAAMPVQSLVTYIAPVQEGEGDPSPDNVRPISGWDAVTAQATGANLLDINAIKSQYIEISGNTITVTPASGTAVQSSNKIKDILPNAKAGMVVTLSGETDGMPRLYIYDNQYFWNFGSSLTLTTAILNSSFYLYGKSDGSAATITGLQIEVGSVATAYEPYNGQTLTAALPETVYGGTVDWTAGQVTVTHKKEVIRSMNIRYTTVGEGFNGGAVNLTDMKENSRANGLCETLKSVSSPAGATNNCIVFGANNQTLYAVISSSLAGTTKDEFNAYLAENPLTVVYPLAEPYTIQLTPQQLSTLKGTNNIWSDAGATDVTYAADTKLYIDGKIAAIAAAIVNE